MIFKIHSELSTEQSRSKTLQSEIENLREACRQYSCPITTEPITNEVVNIVDGYKYEREAIRKWLAYR